MELNMTEILFAVLKQGWPFFLIAISIIIPITWINFREKKKRYHRRY